MVVDIASNNDYLVLREKVPRMMRQKMDTKEPNPNESDPEENWIRQTNDKARQNGFFYYSEKDRLSRAQVLEAKIDPKQHVPDFVCACHSLFTL